MMAFSNQKKGINLKKFIFYAITNVVLFALCTTLLIFLNKVLNLNLRISNMFSDTFGLIILFLYPSN